MPIASLEDVTSVVQDMFATPNSYYERPPSRLLAAEMATPFVFRQGRRYLREATSYPLPVDLAELHRQNLRTLLLIQVFGGPFCSTLSGPPRKVLEIACGAGLWSSACHEYFKRQGHDVSFTGIDIAPLAPDLKKQGVNWKFIQHDLRKPPLPFKDSEFDFIFVNDGMVVFAANPDNPVNPLTNLKKYLKPGGVVEIWESDFHIRCLLPEPTHAPGIATEDLRHAKTTATYTTSVSTPFTKAQNKFIQAYNLWLEAGFQKLGLTVAPCASLGFGLSAEAEQPENFGSRRIAIPFSATRWESDGQSNNTDKVTSLKAKGKESRKMSYPHKVNNKPLTPDQDAVRRTALNVTIGLIESLEPLLKEESGMKQDEWYRWWSNMTTDLLEKEGTANGECLEVGAWWVRKSLRPEEWLHDP